MITKTKDIGLSVLKKNHYNNKNIRAHELKNLFQKTW